MWEGSLECVYEQEKAWPFNETGAQYFRRLIELRYGKLGQFTVEEEVK